MDFKEKLTSLFKKHKDKTTTVGVCSAHMGRYREFDACLNTTVMPKGSSVQWAVGTDAAFNLNQLIRAMPQIKAEYLWILGDDHVWSPDLLLKLLERDVDIVVPYCLRRGTPFWHVLHFDSRRDFFRVPYGVVNHKNGMVDITGLTIGNSGMLVKKQVFDKMTPPWFECGRTNVEVMGTDLYFCEKASDAGFKIWLDLDNVIGHILHMAVWPKQDPDGIWAAEIKEASETINRQPGERQIQDFQPPVGEDVWVEEDVR